MNGDHFLLVLILAYVMDDGDVGVGGKFFIPFMKLTSCIGLLLVAIKRCIQYFA